jgi:hypothetical protein
MSTDPLGLSWEPTKVLIIGRASPEPSKKHIETVCTGGVTEEGKLLRLYPISVRYLEENEKYRLWTWASFDIQKNPEDKRKESYRVRDRSIVVHSQIESWSERFHFLEKAVTKDRETLDGLYRRDWTSLGVVQIELVGFDARIQQKNWEIDKPYIKQFHLYTELKPLEQLPIEMRLKYRCKNNPQCKTHISSLIGWEYMEAFRNFRGRYGTGVAAFGHIKDALERRFSDPSREAYALVGTHFKYGTWMVAQLYFFEKGLSRRLF